MDRDDSNVVMKLLESDSDAIRQLCAKIHQSSPEEAFTLVLPLFALDLDKLTPELADEADDAAYFALFTVKRSDVRATLEVDAAAAGISPDI